jgi:hypothetical protein
MCQSWAEAQRLRNRQSEPQFNGVVADSGRRRTGFRGEAEQRSGLIPNTIPG